MLPVWTEENAHFSSRQERVWLSRRLSSVGAPHNASTATRQSTAYRGSAFAHALGGSDLIIVGVATGMATDADALADLDDSIRPLAVLRAAAELCRGGALIAARSAPKGKARTRRLIRRRLQEILPLPLHILRLTGHGYPERQLCLPGDLWPWLWARAEAA
jgi:hypothetical protein